MNKRILVKAIPARRSTDGDGVQILRNIGDKKHDMDPFLMLDEIHSDDSADYIGGFPPHPHRGIETLTYMLSGGFVHEDSMGHKAELHNGGVQWMLAGRGVIHSELPLIHEGLLHGFQLWINLPATRKMEKPDYHQAENSEMPFVELNDGVKVRTLCGTWELENLTLNSPINHPSANARVLDICLPPHTRLHLATPAQDKVMVYLFDGALANGATQESHSPAAHTLMYFSEGSSLELNAGTTGARLLLLAGTPLNEPIVQYGPFVMNTEDEMRQTIEDYRRGTLLGS